MSTRSSTLDVPGATERVDLLFDINDPVLRKEVTETGLVIIHEVSSDIQLYYYDPNTGEVVHWGSSNNKLTVEEKDAHIGAMETKQFKAWWLYLQTHSSQDEGAHKFTAQWEKYFTDNPGEIPAGGLLNTMAINSHPTGSTLQAFSAVATDNQPNTAAQGPWAFYDPNLGESVSFNSREAADQAQVLAWYQYLQTHSLDEPGTHGDAQGWDKWFSDPGNELSLGQIQALSRLTAEVNRQLGEFDDITRNNPYKDYLAGRNGGLADANIAGRLSNLGGDVGSFGFTVNLGGGQISNATMQGVDKFSGNNFNLHSGIGWAGASNFSIHSYDGSGSMGNISGSYMRGSSPDNFNTVSGEFGVGAPPPTAPASSGQFTGSRQ